MIKKIILIIVYLLQVGYDSGTTAIVALVKGNNLTVANVGDSRCVVCRNGIALDMSIDHKPEDTKELDRIQKAGGKVTGEGRVNGGLNLSRALGNIPLLVMYSCNWCKIN